MTTDNERLRDLFQERSTLSQKEFGKRFGIGTAGMVSQYLLGRRPLNLQAAVKFAEGLGVPLESISPTLAAEVSRAAAVMGAGNTSPAQMRERRIPLLNSVQAGVFTKIGDMSWSDWITVSQGTPDGCFALTVEGDSMSPTFLPGDIIVVDPDKAPKPGSYVVAKVDSQDAATFKKYALRGYDKYGRDVFDLVPINPDYPTIHSTDLPIRIVGTVIEFRRTIR